MFAAMHNPKAAYAKAGIETGVETADPHKLILMLFEGAMLAVASASLHMKRKGGADDVARRATRVRHPSIEHAHHRGSPDHVRHAPVARCVLGT